MNKRSAFIFLFIFLFSGSTLFSQTIQGEWKEITAAKRPSHRQGHTLVGSGEKLYLLGGNDGARALYEFWSWDFGTATWSELGTGRGEPLNGQEGLMLDSGDIAVIGSWPGMISTSGSRTEDNGTVLDDSYLNTVYLYNPDTGAWEIIHPDSAPTNRIGYSVAEAAPGLIFLFGGKDFSRSGFPLVNDLWVFNTGEGTWTEITPRQGPAPRSGSSLTAVSEDELLLWGGEDMNGGYPPEVWKYSVSDGDWKRVETANTPAGRRYHGACFLPGAGLAVLGGSNDEGRMLHPLLLDTETMEWKEIVTPREPRVRSVGDIAPAGRKGFVFFGGGDDPYLFNDMWQLELDL